LPGTSGEDKRVVIIINGSGGTHRATVSRLDAAHGSLNGAYAAMGKPAFPTQAQIQALRKAAALSPPEKLRIERGQLTIVLPPQGLAMIEFH
jgi:xylan 1,4-beta-xylosidase